MDEQQSNKKCILEISELDFIRINEQLKLTIGTKSMSKLSQEMLTMKIDKHLKAESGTGNPLTGLLAESLEGLQGLLVAIQERDKKTEALVGQLKARTEELEKMKSQMAAVLMQFKAEREKHGAKITEMEKLLKERENCIAEGEKVNSSAEAARKSKLDETFSKLFEKNSEISQLREQLETAKTELETTKTRLVKVEAHLKSCLDLSGTAAPSFSSAVSHKHDHSVTLSSVEQAEASPYYYNEDLMYRVYGVMKLRKPRAYILSCLGVDDIFRLKTSCMYMYRVISSDFSVIKALDTCLRKKYDRKALILEKSLSRCS